MGAGARSACHRDLWLGRYSDVLVVLCGQGTRTRSSGRSNAGFRCVHRMLVDSRTPARRAELPGLRRTARVLRLQAPHRVGPACLPRVRSRGVGPCVARDGRVMRPRARSASAEPCGSTAHMGATASSRAEVRQHTNPHEAPLEVVAPVKAVAGSRLSLGLRPRRRSAHANSSRSGFSIMSLMWMRKPHEGPARACAAGLHRIVTKRGTIA